MCSAHQAKRSPLGVAGEVSSSSSIHWSRAVTMIQNTNVSVMINADWNDPFLSFALGDDHESLIPFAFDPNRCGDSVRDARIAARGSGERKKHHSGHHDRRRQRRQRRVQLADAISAHNSKTAVGGCSAGSGNDEIDFSFTGTVFIQNTLEATSGTLTVLGP